MEIKYKDKPTPEEVNQFCSKIEIFLSAHNLKVSIELCDSPAQLKSFTDDLLTKVQNCWIAKCSVTSQATGVLEVTLFNQGIEQSDQKLWHDAWHIQDQIYRKLKLIPQISEPSDPYWKLWDCFPK